jgi:hypothetical protein
MPANPCREYSMLTEAADEALKIACDARVDLLVAKQERVDPAPFMEALRFADSQERRAVDSSAEHETLNGCQSATKECKGRENWEADWNE